LDLSVEDDKLLVGDRPRQSYNPDVKIPLPERLAAQSADELSEVISRRFSIALLPHSQSAHRRRSRVVPLRDRFDKLVGSIP
jgi:hypothetical protein